MDGGKFDLLKGLDKMAKGAAKGARGAFKGMAKGAKGIAKGAKKMVTGDTKKRCMPSQLPKKHLPKRPRKTKAFALVF